MLTRYYLDDTFSSCATESVVGILLMFNCESIFNISLYYFCLSPKFGYSYYLVRPT